MTNSHRRSPLTVEDGLIELGTETATPRWIWAETCPHQQCDCRSALIVASRGDKDALVQAARTAEAIRRNGKGPGDLEVALGDDGVAFEVDIDSGELVPLNGDGESMAGLEQRHPWLGSVLEAIDGELLEQLGRWWYRGKGRPDPESSAQPPACVRSWMPGNTVSWEEAYFGVRQDIYLVETHAYAAVEHYCVMPDCRCCEVHVRFDDLRTDDGVVGTAVVEQSGEWKLEPESGPPELLERLWAMYRKRHPNYGARHAQRYPRMKAYGETLVAYHAAKANASRKKPRPNEPCPCGSGKKYKKCCWLTKGR